MIVVFRGVRQSAVLRIAKLAVFGVFVVTDPVAGSFFGQAPPGRGHEKRNAIPASEGRSSRPSTPNGIGAGFATASQRGRGRRGRRGGRGRGDGDAGGGRSRGDGDAGGGLSFIAVVVHQDAAAARATRRVGSISGSVLPIAEVAATVANVIFEPFAIGDVAEFVGRQVGKARIVHASPLSVGPLNVGGEFRGLGAGKY